MPLLNPVILPNLRTLALSSYSLLELLSQPAFVEILPQLDSLEVDGDTWHESKVNFLRSHASSVLVDCCSLNLSPVLDPQLHIHHIRFIDLFDSAPYERFRHLDTFTARLSTETSSLPLRSIYLDSSLHPNNSSHDSPHNGVQDLVAACQERKIDVVFEPVPRKYFDPSLSQEFYKRQQGSKKR